MAQNSRTYDAANDCWREQGSDLMYCRSTGPDVFDGPSRYGRVKQLAASGQYVPNNDRDEMAAMLDRSPAPRVTPQQIENTIKQVTYYHHGLLTICVLDLVNGFTVTGESACAAPENYSRVIGEQISYDMAKQKIWPLEGYVLRQNLHDNEQLQRMRDQLNEAKAADGHRDVGA